MIPYFPHFSKLKLQYKNEVEKLLESFSPYSDLNFVNLWTYNLNEEILVSKLNDNLVFKLYDYITTQPIYTFIGKNEVLNTIDTLLEFMKDNKLKPELKLIPEELLTSNPQIEHNFEIEEDRNNFDYIISLEKTSKLEGKHFTTKRRLINKIKNNSSMSIRPLNLKDSHIIEKINQLFLTWQKEKKLEPSDNDQELKALNRLINMNKKFKIIAIGIFMNEDLVGFAIDELSHKTYAMGYFMKTNPNYDGVSILLHKASAESLLVKGYKYKNIQQDLGIIGLRKSKELWQPVKYLKKYSIKRKE